MERKLWYNKEAVIWEEGLPVGNGRIGAMVLSHPVNDKLQINEDTLWSGYPNMVKQKHNIEELNEIRELIKNKNYIEANKKTAESMFNLHSQCYLPYGNLYIDTITEEKNIDTAIFLRTYFLRQDTTNYTNQPSINLWIQNNAKKEQIDNLKYGSLINSYNLTAFGSIEEMYGSNSIVNSEVENLAKQVDFMNWNIIKSLLEQWQFI